VTQAASASHGDSDSDWQLELASAARRRTGATPPAGQTSGPAPPRAFSPSPPVRTDSESGRESPSRRAGRAGRGGPSAARAAAWARLPHSPALAPRFGLRACESQSRSRSESEPDSEVAAPGPPSPSATVTVTRHPSPGPGPGSESPGPSAASHWKPGHWHHEPTGRPGLRVSHGHGLGTVTCQCQ
jgi:hypothetical protein